jgi:hypothetical protein
MPGAVHERLISQRLPIRRMLGQLSIDRGGQTL